MSVRSRVGRAVWMEVNLDAVTHNVELLRKLSKNANAGMIAVVKANGMGHGAVTPSRHLKRIGVERLAVATVEEGAELRGAGIPGPIHLLGNVQDYEMPGCLKYDLIPTVADKDAILGMKKAMEDHSNTEETLNHNGLERCSGVGTVHIKVDSGMSRNGCQTDELDELVQLCKECHVPLEGMFTHLACWDVPEFNKMQLDTFLEATKPYRNQGILFHASNSGGSMVASGSDLDFIRPGISIFGAPPSNDKEIMQRLGFKPTTAVRGTPTLVKKLSAGRKIGYDATHTCESDSWIATFPLGYADGLWRAQGQRRGRVIRDKTGE